MKKSIIFLLMIFMPAVSAASSTAGTTVVPFLKYGAGARAAGMGSAFTAVPGAGSDMVYWNPAGLAAVSRRDATLMYLSGLEDISYGWASFAEPASYGVFGAAIQYMSSGNMPGTDIYGDSSSDFSTYDLALNFAFARSCELNRAGFLDYGVNLKYIYSKIDNSASAFALDGGAIYTLIDEATSVGAVFQNAGTEIKYNEESESLPFVFKLGVSRVFFNDTLLLALDVSFPNDNDVFASCGGEYLIPLMHDASMALRAGYDGRQKDIDGFSGLNAGFGLKYRDYSFDYAFSPYGDLGNVHRVSLGIQFGEEFNAEAAAEKKELKKQKKAEKAKEVRRRASQEAQKPQQQQPVRQAQEEAVYGEQAGDYSGVQSYEDYGIETEPENINLKSIAVIDFYSRNIPASETSVYSEMLRKQLGETGVYLVSDSVSVKQAYSGTALPSKTDTRAVMQSTGSKNVIVCNSLKQGEKLIFHFTVYDEKLNYSEYSFSSEDSFKAVNEAMRKFAEKIAGAAR